MSPRGRFKLVRTLACLLGVASLSVSSLASSQNENEAMEVEAPPPIEATQVAADLEEQEASPELSEELEYWGPPSPAAREEVLARELGQDRNQFCNDPDYVLFKVERRLCDHAEGARERCPAFPAVCERSPELDRESPLFGFGFAGRSADPERVQEPEEPWELDLPDWLVAPFNILYFVLAGAAFLLLGIYLVRNLDLAGKQRDSSVPGASSEAPDTQSRNAATVVESDVARLLARAKASAQNGDYNSATNDVYAALLRYLDHLALISLHPSKTNGDYVRDLKPHAEWRSALRDSATSVERHQFGDAPPDQASFWKLLGKVEPLVTRPLAVMLLLWAAALPLTGCGPESDFGRSGSSQWGALGDHTALGFSTLATLLEQQGFDVDNHRGSVEDISPEVDILFIHDRTSLTTESWASLERWVAEGHQLVIAGDIKGAAYFGASVHSESCEGPLRLTERYTGVRRKDETPYESPATLVGRAHTALFSLPTEVEAHAPVTCADGALAIVKVVGDGSVTLLPDADLLANASLAANDNALIFLDSLPQGPGSIAFAGGLVGAGASSPMESLANAKLNVLLLQLALFLGVLYWARGARFAKPRDPDSEQRREFLDHIQAVGKLFARGRAAGYALGVYSTWALERLHRRIRPGARASVIELSTAIATRTGRSPNEVLRILAEAASSRDREDTPGDQTEDLKTLKELEALMIESGGTK